MTLQQELTQYYKQVKSGKLPGISTGFKLLDKAVGRIEPQQIWVVGGKSGVGKSFFALNVAENLIAQDKQVSLFTTELSEKAYAIRHAMMRAGLYKKAFEEQPAIYGGQVGKQLQSYIENVVPKLKIYPVSSYEEVSKLIIESTPDVAIIDYIQELSIDKVYSKQDTMPLLGAKLKELAMVTGVPIIVVSQVKNGVLDADAYTTQQTPYDFGKELNNAAHNAIWLQRKKNADGTVEPILTAVITKARDGELGSIEYKINKGYKLEECPPKIAY